MQHEGVVRSHAIALPCVSEVPEQIHNGYRINLRFPNLVVFFAPSMVIFLGSDFGVL